MSSIQMTMRSTQDWRAIEKAQELIDILVAEGDFMLPEKFDNREPERLAFDPGDLAKLLEFWTSNLGWLFLKRRKPYPARVVVHTWLREAKRFNDLTAGFDERYFRKEGAIAKLLSGARRLYNWGAITHGYICHEEDWNTKNYFGVPTRVTGGKVASTGGLWLEQHLPGIYWANFFGPLYVQFFGRAKFLTAPAYSREELPDGGFLLLTSSSPFDYVTPEVRKLQQMIIDHLGQEAFFEKARPEKSAYAPPFTFEQASFGRPIEVVTYDPIVEVIPDIDRFIQDAAVLAEELVRRVSFTLDYSPESLEDVDNFILKQATQQPAPWGQAINHQLLQQLTAYYGEVLRRNLQGNWVTHARNAGSPHPAVAFLVDQAKEIEYPFTRVVKLWIERQRTDGLAVRYHLLTSGQLKRAEQYLFKDQSRQSSKRSTN